MMLAKGRTVFIADTTVHELPDTKTLADIAIQTARTVAAHGLHAARGPAVVRNLRQPAGLQGRRASATWSSELDRRQVTSSMTARWRPTSRSTPS